MLPFKVSKLFGTVAKVHGMAIANAEGLRLVFHERSKKPVGLFEAQVESVMITWSNLADLTVDLGLLADEVIIKVRSLEGLGDDLPGLEENEVRLETLRRERDKLEVFQSQVVEYRSGKTDEDVDEFLNDLDEFIDRM